MRRWPGDYVDKVLCGDALEIMPEIPDGAVDLVLTDPPYNATNIGPKDKVYSQGQMQLPEEEYDKFCGAWFKEARRIARTVVFTPGTGNISGRYPRPTWAICWHKPAAVSFNRMGGFNAWEPIFVYGKSTRRVGQDYIKLNTLNAKKGIEGKHPCPKPLALWDWLVYHFAKEDFIVLDPFLGSGTTALSCKKFRCHYVGIEINPDYCTNIVAPRLANLQPELPLQRS